MWKDLGYVLEVKSVGFANWLGVESEGRKRVKTNSQIWGFNCWVDAQGRLGMEQGWEFSLHTVFSAGPLAIFIPKLMSLNFTPQFRSMLWAPPLLTSHQFHHSMCPLHKHTKCKMTPNKPVICLPASPWGITLLTGVPQSTQLFKWKPGPRILLPLYLHILPSLFLIDFTLDLYTCCSLCQEWTPLPFT